MPVAWSEEVIETADRSAVTALHRTPSPLQGEEGESGTGSDIHSETGMDVGINRQSDS